MIDREEYLEHISHFCEANEGKREVWEGGNRFTAYHSFRAILADRVKYGKIVEKKYSKDFVALTKGNCGTNCGVGYPTSPFLEVREGDQSNRYTNKLGYENNFCFYHGNEIASLVLNKQDSILGHLTYDGLCAYMGLASNENLVANRAIIADEIARNAKEEMLRVEVEGENSAQEISDIGNKYLELQCVAREVLTRAQEEFDLKEEENEESYVNAAQAYSNAMAKLSEVPLTENEEVEE